jgi:hypothetical protein
MALGNALHRALLRPALVETLQQHHPDHHAQRINLRLRFALQRIPTRRGQHRLEQTQQRLLVNLSLHRRLSAENTRANSDCTTQNHEATENTCIDVAK